jgi:L-amino acid N-acyltransferase YncA
VTRTGRIRRATPADVPAVVQLVHDLAEYEKASAECTLTVEQLQASLFGPAPALFAHVAEDETGVVGCAIWFRNFSTWKGVHGIYLEDLYVKPETRGKGYGKALLTALAQEAVSNGYGRLDWAVLTWNTPSIDFYKSLGAAGHDEWVGYRLEGEALEALGRNGQ